MSLKEPIVEGAYYEREDGSVVGPARRQASLRWDVGGWTYEQNGAVSGYGIDVGVSLTRRVHLIPTDPAEVVAELRRMAHICSASAESTGSRAFDTAADLVTQKLEVVR